MSNSVIHQLLSAALILIGSVKMIFGYFVIKSAADHGDLRIAFKRPWRATFRLMLGLTKATSDAPLYIILGILTAASSDRIELWAVVWVCYSCVVQLATFLRWAEDQGGRERA